MAEVAAVREPSKPRFQTLNRCNPHAEKYRATKRGNRRALVRLLPMTQLFFSHASEDKPLVEAVYQEFVSAFPHYKPWVDKYEIVGGDSLVEKIASGMDQANKFFIFLSPISVEKPWVKKELHRALIREIYGTQPYIIPVKVGDLKSLPPFLEEKLYIDLPQLTKPEWLAQFDAAIKGVAPAPGQGASNVSINGQYGTTTNVALITFEAKAWAEEFSFGVVTSEDIIKGAVDNHNLFMNRATAHDARAYATRFTTPELKPGKPVTLRIEFAEGVDAMQAIDGAGRWDTEAQTIEVNWN